MANTVTIRLVEDNSELVKQASREAIERALEAVGMQAEGYAKMLCPVDTGNLRNSLTHEVKDSEKAVYVGTNVEYAPYVEYGTVKTRKQPYLEPAIMNHVDEYKRIAEEFLRNG